MPRRRHAALRALLCSSVGLLAGCPTEPPPPLPDVGIRSPPIDAGPLPAFADANFDAAAPEDGALSLPDVWLERTDGCVVPFASDRVGLPCDEATDCPTGLACLPATGLEPSASCQMLAIEGCDCPAGTAFAPYVTAGAAFTICARGACPMRETDASALGRACASLSDCPDWMICEAGASGTTCELPCSEQCACPGGTSCTSRARPDGVAQRCE